MAHAGGGGDDPEQVPGPGADRAGAHPHHDRGPSPSDVVCAVLTVSSTRTPDTDDTGPAVGAALADAGFEVVSGGVVGDDVAAIRTALEDLAGRADAVVLAGGTGPAPSDVTPEAVRPLLVVELPGFGERFRRAGQERVGEAAWLSRALAGVMEVGDGRRVAVVCLPGSPDGARLGAEIAAGALAHLVGLVRPRDEG